MKSKTKHAKKQKSFVIRESDYKKMQREVQSRVASMSIYIFLAWLKEAEYINDDPEVLIAEYNRLESWFKAIDDHLISVDAIKDIIERDTGIEVRIRNGEKNGEDQTA